MTLEQSFAILGVDSSSSEEQRLSAYRDLKERLETKLGQAPTEGLAKKYKLSLEQVDAAIEVVESSFDAKEFPGLVVVESGAGSIEPRVLDDGKKNEPVSIRRRWVLMGVCGIAIVGAGIWAAQQNALEQQRLAAERKMAAVEEAERLAESVRAEKEALHLENRRRLEEAISPVKNELERVDAMLSLSEERLRDLRGAERIASEKDSKSELEIAQYRLQRYEAFADWLGKKAKSLPARTQLDEAADLFDKGLFEEALKSLDGISVDVEAFAGELESAKEDQYEAPVAAFLLEREFANASRQSELAEAKKEYLEAIDSIEPFLAEAATKEAASERLKEIYRTKSSDAFERAEQAAGMGEFQKARTILATLDGDPETSRAEDELKLVQTLNSEYALEQALIVADEALERNDFDGAREALKYLVEDPRVGTRAKEDLAWIDGVETVWKRNTLELRTEQRGAEGALGQAGTLEPDSGPRLIRKVSPIYPDILMQNKVSGFVDLVCVIGLDGKAKDIDVVSSSRREFELPAVEALKRWRFQPAESEGVPMEMRVRQRMLFNPKP